ncbi:hypothetical protein CSW22_09125, partial [Thermus scotoductus]
VRDPVPSGNQILGCRERVPRGSGFHLPEGIEPEGDGVGSDPLQQRTYPRKGLDASPEADPGGGFGPDQPGQRLPKQGACGAHEVYRVAPDGAEEHPALEEGTREGQQG